MKLLQNTEKKRVALMGLAVFLLLLFVPLPTWAIGFDTVGRWVAQILGSIAEGFATLMGALLIKAINVLVGTAKYNDFIGLRSAPGSNHPVEVGWVIVRDFSNMFFIVILLVIAFGTMLRAKNYNYRELLPRLLVMALLINFSRTIVGFVIDAAQVAMLTFVNAFQSVAGGNFLVGLGLQNVFQITENAGPLTDFKLAISMILVDVFLAIALMTVLVIVMTLVIRIVMLWMITILAPAAFLLSTFPRGQKYYGEWWDQLICWALSGPVLAFFLWLALATMASGGSGVANQVGEPTGEGPDFPGGAQLVTQLANDQNIARFMIGIVMLLFGVQTAQQFCGVGTGIVRGTGQYLQRKGVGAAKLVAAGGIGYALAGARGAGRGAVGAARGAGSFADYKFRQFTGGTGVREAIYGGRWSPIRAVAPEFARGRLARLQQAPSEQYKKAQTEMAAAASASPEQAIRLGMRKPVFMTADKAAARAGELKTLITSTKVYDQLKKQYGEDGAKSRTREWFNEYEQVAKTSGNPDVLEGWKEVKKQNPHLLKDTGEVRKVAEKLNTTDVLKVEADAFSDLRFTSALDDKLITRVEERGSGEQKANLRQALAARNRLADLKPEEVAGYVQSEGEAGKQNLTAFYDVIAKKNPETAKKILQEGHLDPKFLRGSQFEEDDGEMALTFAKTASPELLGEVTSKKDLAGGLLAGLEAARQKMQKGGKQFSADEAQQVAETMFMAGADAASAFRDDRTSLESALRGSRGTSTLRAIGPKRLKAETTTREAVLENVQPEQLLTMTSGGNKEEIEMARAIAKAVAEAAKDEDAPTGVSQLALALKQDPVLRRLLYGRKPKPGAGGGEVA